MPPGSNQFSLHISTTIDLGNLPTLPERLDGYLIEALTFHLKDPVEKILGAARGSLHTLGHVPGDPAGPHVDEPGGYRSGLLAETLTSDLVEGLLTHGIVAYDLSSHDAEYWQWIEFGHWVKNAREPWFWEGYHMLERAIEANIPAIRNACREAWRDTAMKLAGEAHVSMPGLGVNAGPIRGAGSRGLSWFGR